MTTFILELTARQVQLMAVLAHTWTQAYPENQLGVALIDELVLQTNIVSPRKEDHGVGITNIKNKPAGADLAIMAKDLFPKENE